MTFWKRQNYGDNEKISGRQRLGAGVGMKRRLQRICVGVKLLRVDMVVMDTFVTPVDI